MFGRSAPASTGRTLKKRRGIMSRVVGTGNRALLRSAAVTLIYLWRLGLHVLFLE